MADRRPPASEYAPTRTADGRIAKTRSYTSTTTGEVISRRQYRQRYELGGGLTMEELARRNAAATGGRTRTYTRAGKTITVGPIARYQMADLLRSNPLSWARNLTRLQASQDPRMQTLIEGLRSDDPALRRAAFAQIGSRRERAARGLISDIIRGGTT